jgi:hypothetical protein
LWAIPLILLVAALAYNLVEDRSDADDRHAAEQRERDARSSDEPVNGNGYRIENTYCEYDDTDASYSGTLTNTSGETASYWISVFVVDQNGTRVGGSSTSVSDLPTQSRANFEVQVTLHRFVDGPPANQCLVTIEQSPLTPGGLDISQLNLPADLGPEGSSH